MVIQEETGMLALLQKREEELKKQQEFLEAKQAELQKQPETPENKIELEKLTHEITDVKKDLEDNKVYKQDEIDKEEINKARVDAISDNFDNVILPNYDHLRNTKTEVQVPPVQKPLIDVKESQDAVLGTVVAAVALMSMAHEVLKEDPPSKKWEKDIDKNEKEINEKYDKEIKDTDKAMEKHLNNVDKYYPDEKENLAKKEALTDTMTKVKEDIEKDRAKELHEKVELSREHLDNAFKDAKGMNDLESQKLIEERRQAELQRQKELEERNKTR